MVFDQWTLNGCVELTLQFIFSEIIENIFWNTSIVFLKFYFSFWILSYILAAQFLSTFYLVVLWFPLHYLLIFEIIFSFLSHIFNHFKRYILLLGVKNWKTEKKRHSSKDNTRHIFDSSQQKKKILALLQPSNHKVWKVLNISAKLLLISLLFKLLTILMLKLLKLSFFYLSILDISYN